MRATHRDVIVPSPFPEGVRRANAEQSGLRRLPPPPPPPRRDTMPSLWREVTAGAPVEDPDPTYTPPPLPPREQTEKVDLDALVEPLSVAPPPPLVVPPVALPTARRSTAALPWALAAAALVVAAFLAGLLTAQRADAPTPPASHAAAPAPRITTLEPIVFESEPAADAPSRSSAVARDAIRPARRPVRAAAPSHAEHPSRAERPEAAHVEAPGRAETPSRAEVRAALAGVTPRVEACARPADAGQRAHVRLTFGSDGRALHAVVDGVSGVTASCIAQAARGARVPPFAREHFVVAAPFTL